MQATSTLSRDLVLEVSQKLQEPRWLLEKRLAAWEAFARLPYPTLKTEEWRYTNLSKVPLEGLALELPTGQKLSRQDLPAQVRSRLEQAELSGVAVFVGADLVYLELPEELQAQGVVLTSIAQALQTHEAPIQNALFRTMGWNEKLQAYNAALFTHGAFLFVPKGVEFDAPIGVFNYLEGGRLSIGRTLIVAEPNSKAVYIEEYVSPTPVHEGVNL